MSRSGPSDLSQVGTARVRLLYRQSPVALVGAGACLAALVAGLSGEVAPSILVPWAGVTATLHIGRYLLSRVYRALDPPSASTGRWEWTFDVGMVLVGAAWGSAGILLFPAGSVVHQVFLAFILGGISTGAVATYAASSTGGAGFFLLAMLPLATRFVTRGTPLQVYTGVMLYVYTGILLAVAHNMHRTIVESLRLHQENRDLVKDLTLSEQRYRSIVDSTLSGIVVVDDAFRIVFANEAIEGLTGLDSTGLTDRDFRELLDEEDRELVEERYLRRQQGKEVPRRYEIGIRGGDGTTRRVEINTALIRDPEGGPRTVAQLLDTTDRRKSEEALLLASRMEATRTLAAGVAHDFNNLLVGILGNAELLQIRSKRGRVEPEDLGLRLQAIRDAADRAGSLAQQLLAFARGGGFEPETLALERVLDDTVRLQEGMLGPDVDIRRDVTGDLWPVQADPAQVGQVIMNLCINAGEAMEGEGTLTLRARNIRVGEGDGVTLRSVGTGEWVVLEVEDSGPGMSEEVKRRVFEPFFTTKAKGRGLGLAACYGIVARHGGRILVDSKLGEGTRFRIYLPRSEDPLPGSRPESHKVPMGTETILVIDDEQRVRDVAHALLENLGYTVLTAGDGLSALEILVDRHREIDLALLNLKMPGTGGIELLPRLRETCPDIRVVLCSGYENEAGTSEVPEEHFHGFLPKPFTLGTLGSKVREALDLPRQAAGV
ncbi:MAG: PAS domain S-box protein [bacterium]